MCMGFRGLPLMAAGQLSVQRPHSVQARPSKTCFQLRSSRLRAPKYSMLSSSASIFRVRMRPFGSMSMKNMLRGEAKTWLCLL
jgi:hypothetical protein